MEEEKHSQTPTIKDAVTYIVDENGEEHELNELENTNEANKSE